MGYDMSLHNLPCDLILGTPCGTVISPAQPPIDSSSSTHYRVSTSSWADPAHPSQTVGLPATSVHSLAPTSSYPSTPASSYTSSLPIPGTCQSTSSPSPMDCSPAIHIGTDTGIAFGIAAGITILVAVTFIYAVRQNYRGKTVTNSVEDEEKGAGLLAVQSPIQQVPTHVRCSSTAGTLSLRPHSQQDGSLVGQPASTYINEATITLETPPARAMTTPRRTSVPRQVGRDHIRNTAVYGIMWGTSEPPQSPRETRKDSDNMFQLRSRSAECDGRSIIPPSYDVDGCMHDSDPGRRDGLRRDASLSLCTLTPSLPPSYSSSQ